MKRFFQLNPFKITVIAIVAGMTAYVYGILNPGVNFLNLIELKTIDMRFHNRGQITPGGHVAIAVVDEKSLAKEGKWVWPRSKFAQLINKLSDAGAKVIAFDIGFLEPDEKDRKLHETVQKIKSELEKAGMKQSGVEKAGMEQSDLEQSGLEQSGLMQYLDSFGTDSDNDQQLADAIRNAKAKVVLGYFFHTSQESSEHLREEDIKKYQDNIVKAQYKLIQYESMEAQSIPLRSAFAPQPNIRIVADAAEYAGFFNMFPDNDGGVRWIPAVLRFRDSLYAPLSLMAVSAYLDAPIQLKIAVDGIRSAYIRDLEIPLHESTGDILINYRGREKTFPHISITDIINDNIEIKDVKDKIIFVGATAIGIYDMRVTPFGTPFPGVEVHANMADMLLSEDFISQPDWVIWVFNNTVIIITALILGFLLSKTGIITGSVLAVLLSCGYILLGQYIFNAYGLIINLVYPCLTMLMIYIGITANQFIAEARQKMFIRNAFSTYLAPSVVESLIKSPEKLGLGGEERVITAFFSDVQGFTGISEKLTPPKLVELLNEFLTEMTDIILRHKGTVDKFEGDAIIAFFGAPYDLENQAEAACIASIEMQKRLGELREMWREKGKPELKMRIGLCTGTAVVGNMGSKNRMDYTMMGDTVNTAARLEGVNKVYGSYTLIGDTTRGKLDERILTRELDQISVVGREKPIVIYELIDFIDEAEITVLEMKKQYEDALELYRKQRWEEAIKNFERILKELGDDPPSRMMIGRCREFMENPPDENWNGVFSMVSK